MSKQLDTRGSNSRKYAIGQHCAFDDCTNQAVCKDLCTGHYAQRKAGKRLRPLQDKRGRKPMGGYSETKTCDTCLETKHWSKFVMGTDRSSDECRECYRERILPVCVEPDVNSLDEVLDYIDMYFPVE